MKYECFDSLSLTLPLQATQVTPLPQHAIFTYIELMHAQLNRHMVLLGVVDIIARFVVFIASIYCQDAEKKVFATSDYMIKLTDHQDA